MILNNPPETRPAKTRKFSCLTGLHSDVFNDENLDLRESEKIDDGEVDENLDVSEAEEIDDNFIWYNVSEEINNDEDDENLDAEIARLSSKRSEFNPSVAKSDNLEDHSWNWNL